MTPEAQRIAILEYLGYRRIGLIEGSPDLMGELPPTRGWIRVSDPLSDLNAMHEAEKKLTDEQFDAFTENLGTVLKCDFFFKSKSLRAFLSATAAQRAEALLRTIGKWRSKDTPGTIASGTTKVQREYGPNETTECWDKQTPNR